MGADDGMVPTLAERVARLARARVAAENWNEHLRILRAGWESEHAHDITQQRDSAAELEAANSALREAVLTAYRADPTTRKPVVGAEVVLSTKYAYDGAQALAWARESGVALKLDAKLFEKVAKDAALPFVTITQEPTVRVASDLSAALAATTPESV